MKHLLIFFFLAPILVKAQTDSDWKTYSKDNYSIQYPSSWVLNEDGPMGTDFMLFAPKKNEKDQFQANLCVMVQDLSDTPMTLDEFSALSKEQITVLMTNCKILVSKNVTGTKTYHRMIYTCDQGQFHFKFEQYYYVENNKAYVLTFTSEKSSYSHYEKTAKQILDSFTYK